MNTTPLKTTALMLTVFLSFHACKDDEKPTEEQPPAKPTTKELLMNKKWIQTEWYVYPAMADDQGDSTNDMFQFLASCQKDDWQTYLQDSIYEHHAGEIKCSPQVPDVSYSKWYINAAMDSLTIENSTVYIDSIAKDYLRVKNEGFLPPQNREFISVFRIKE